MNWDRIPEGRYACLRHAMAPSYGRLKAGFYRCSHCGADEYVDTGASLANLSVCMSRVYCSFACKTNDAPALHGRGLSQMLRRAEDTALAHRTNDIAFDFVHKIWEGESDDEILRGLSSPEVVERTRAALFRKRTFLVVKCEIIDLLLAEGFTLMRGARNEWAIDNAVQLCKDMIYLQHRPTEFCGWLQSIYLHADRTEDVYTLSCNSLRTSQNLWQTPHSGVHMARFRNDVWLGRLDQIQITEPMPSPITCYGAEDICHAYVAKYFMFADVKNLVLLDRNFLNSVDCISLIGEYLGVHRKWIAAAPSTFLDQAKDLLRHLHIDMAYLQCTGSDIEWSCTFQSMTAFSKRKNFAAPLQERLEEAFSTAKGWLDDRKQDLLMKEGSDRNAAKTNLVRDHKFILDNHILPELPIAVQMINARVGWGVFGMTAHDISSLSGFIKDCIDVCPKKDNFFENLFEWLIYGWDYDGACEVDQEDPPHNEDRSSWNESCDKAFLACLHLELKFAQIHFHDVKNSEKVGLVLDQLPRERSHYLNLDQSNPPLVDEIPMLPGWLADIAEVLQDLVHAGIATKNNLNDLFGNHEFVSFVVWQLKQDKLALKKPDILRFVRRTRIWKEGYTEFDEESGLKIKYLSKDDRRDLLFKSYRQLPLSCYAQELEPPLSQFVARFGWSQLGIKNVKLRALFDDEIPGAGDSIDRTGNKKARLDLHTFDTVETACLHFFDSNSVEEAMWDLAGVPRVVLDRPMQKIMQSPWRNYVGPRPKGNKTVKLGSRVAFHYNDGACSILTEAK